MFDTCIFPSPLKSAEIRPIHKKGDVTDKGNYRPISLLPAMSKVFERILFDQINTHFSNIFSPFLCGFRSGHSTQHAILNILLKWQKCLDEKGIVGTVLMDLSKAYDCLSHELLIAKLAAYGFSKKSLRLVYSFLKGRKQRVKIGKNVSNCLELIQGVPQGSILGSILFNIFINDFFLFIMKTILCNFADDNTISACDFSLEIVIRHLTADLERAIYWYKINSLVANPKKFQMIFFGISIPQELNVAGVNLVETETVRLLGIDIDKKLSFEYHIKNLCKFVNNKTNALLRIRNYIDIPKARKILNSYILSQFNYCCIIWMFCSKKCNNSINKAHKRALRAVYQNWDASLEELLDVDGSVKIHTRNLRVLMTEVFKSLNKLNPNFMWEIFRFKETPYSLRCGKPLTLPQTINRRYGLDGLNFRASLTWNNLPQYIKCADTLFRFKSDIKTLIPINFGCKLCQVR